MRKAFILVLAFALLATSAFAEIKAGYILKNPSNPVQQYVDAMQDLNISISYLDSDLISSYNLSQYDFIFVANEQFPNSGSIPVNNYPALIANFYHMDTWHWSNEVSQMGTSNPMYAVNSMPSHFITQGMPLEIPIYTRCCFDFPPVSIPLLYLKLGDRAPAIDSVVSRRTAPGDVAIGTIEPGENLRDGVVATKKGVFYGAPYPQYWTPEAEQLFKNSILWLVGDTTNPVISNVRVEDLTSTSATIKFDTDDLSSAEITIKKNGLPFMTLYGTEYVSSHSYIAQGLSPQTAYTYTIKACNGYGYCTTSPPYTLTTPPVPDSTPPVLSNLSLEVDETSVEISFVTDDLSNTSISYGLTQSLGSTFESNSLEQNHFHQIGNLQDNTLYYYSIKVCNPSATCATYGTYNFTTLRIPDSTPPVISNIAVQNITHNSALVSYDTDDNSNMTLKYGLTPSFGSTVTNQGFAQNFEQPIGGLSYNTTYYFQITSCNTDGYCNSSSTSAFTTLMSDDIILPSAPTNLIAEVINSNNSIKLSWTASTSNDTAGYHIYVAPTPSGFNFNSVDQTVTSSPFIDIGAMNVSQRFYVVRAFDAVGNEENNTNIVGKFDINLFQGYNLVSLPILPFSTNLESVMHEDASYNPVREVLEWAGSSFEKATFELTEGDYWKNNGVDDIIPGTGYFFNSMGNITFTIVGTPIISQQNIPLVQGENLVGWSSLDTRTFASGISNPLIREVSRKSSNGRFEVATYYSQGWFSADGFTALEPGKGYWIKAEQNTTWPYTP